MTYLTVADVARRTLLTEPQVRHRLKELEAVKVGGRWLIPEAVVNEKLGDLRRSTTARDVGSPQPR